MTGQTMLAAFVSWIFVVVVVARIDICQGTENYDITIGASCPTAIQDKLSSCHCVATPRQNESMNAATQMNKKITPQADAETSTGASVIAGNNSQKTAPGKDLGKTGSVTKQNEYDQTKVVDDRFHTPRGGQDSLKQVKHEAGSGKYGDIISVETTGASRSTARQDMLGYYGVAASRQMATTDAGRMEKYKNIIIQAALETSMDAAIIAGIISRETRAGNVLGKNGFGYDGHEFGIMQVHDLYHIPRGGPYSLEHIKQGAEILRNSIDGVRNEHPTWTSNMILKGGISAYNAGVKNVWTYENMDVGTTGNDYANDVTARAQWYKENGY